MRPKIFEIRLHPVRVRLRIVTFALQLACCLTWPGRVLAAPAGTATSAMVDSIIGKASVVRGTKNEPLRKGMLLGLRDRVVVSSKAAVKLNFTDGSSTTLFENTDMTLQEAKIRGDGTLVSTMDVLKGKVRFFVKPKSGKPNAVRFRTANAVMGVRGTSGVIVSKAGRSEFYVTTGEVEISSRILAGAKLSVAPVNVKAGFTSSVVGKQAPTAPKTFEMKGLEADPFPSAKEAGGKGSEGTQSEEAKDGSKEDDKAKDKENKGENGQPKKEDPSKGSEPSEGNGGVAPLESAAPASAAASPEAPLDAQPTSQPEVPSASLQSDSPVVKTMFTPEGTTTVSVSTGSISAIVPKDLNFGTAATAVQGSQAVLAAGVATTRTVETLTRDIVEKSQTAAGAAGPTAPKTKQRTSIDVRVEGSNK